MTYHYDRESDQLPVHGVSTESIMRTAAFARGVGDKRSGRPPRYDDFMFDQDAGDHMAKATINAHWHYERGRQAPSAADVVRLLQTAYPNAWEKHLRNLGVTAPADLPLAELVRFTDRVFWLVRQSGIKDPAAWLANLARVEATVAPVEPELRWRSPARRKKPETEETTMVRRADLHNVSRIAGAVSARAPSGSASLTGLQIVYLPPECLRPSPNNARTHSKKQLKDIARSIVMLALARQRRAFALREEEAFHAETGFLSYSAKPKSEIFSEPLAGETGAPYLSTEVPQTIEWKSGAL